MFSRAGVAGVPIFTSKLQAHDAHHGLCGDLIYCQRLRSQATGRAAAHHVGTRRVPTSFLVEFYHPVRSATDDRKVVLLMLQSLLSNRANICTGFTQSAAA